MIHLTTAPATDWTGIRDTLSKFEPDDTDAPGLVIFIGCGATLNLTDYLNQLQDHLGEKTKLLCTASLLNQYR